MRWQMRAIGVAVAGTLGVVSGGEAAEKFQRLSGGQIKARFAGMEMSDDVHWRDRYERNGTLTSRSMGRKRTGKWRIVNNELCVERGGDVGGCYEVWIAGKKVELRRPGLDVAILDGVLQRPTKRE